MPIYAYRCSDCGFEKDALQKMSDPPLTTCPACGKETFSKQVTAAGFQLKGSGWYVTDFRGGQGKKESSPAGKSEGASTGTAAGEAGASSASKPSSSAPSTGPSAE